MTFIGSLRNPTTFIFIHNKAEIMLHATEEEDEQEQALQEQEQEQEHEEEEEQQQEKQKEEQEEQGIAKQTDTTQILFFSYFPCVFIL